MTAKRGVKTSATVITIKPDDFTDSQWTGAYYAGGDELLKCDLKCDAEPVQATPGEIKTLALLLRAKAESVLEGDYRDQHNNVNEEEWATDLMDAAEVLERYLLEGG